MPARREVLVLCALGRAKPVSLRRLEGELERTGGGGESAVEVLARLRAQGLVAEHRRVATEDGKRHVREAFALSRVPTWAEAKRHAAARALGLAAGSVEAQRTFEQGSGKLPAAILAQHFGLAHTTNVRSLCEALLFAKLGITTIAVRDNRLLGHVLAHRAGIAPSDRGELEAIAARIAASLVGARGPRKEMLVEALARRWFAGEPATPAASTSFDETVRAGLSRVPASGRYGVEKVFIASLWDAIAREAPAEMDLFRFKRWLVDANAKQVLVLARADLVGAMDPARVAASEIVDRGASFHFVVDHH